MAARKISPEDWVEISNLIGKYQWLVDDGDEEGWSGLFTEDGAFLGAEGGYRGREALKGAAAMTREFFDCLMRHSTGAIWIEYGDDEDEAIARYYSLVTIWRGEADPEFFNMALCKVHLLRIDGDWIIKSNTIRGLSKAL